MKRNIVMITIDSLRADRCGYVNEASDLTPTLDRMADEGFAFEKAIAPGPKTPESMPAVFTGEFSAERWLNSDIRSWQNEIQPHMRKRETLTERLSNLGYETIAFSPNGFASEYFGFDEGFDFFEDFLDEEIRPGMDFPNLLRGLIKYVRKEGNWKTWEKYYEYIVETVNDASEPYFLWVFLLDVHSPYLVPRKYRQDLSWLDMMHGNLRCDRAAESESVRRKLVSAYDATIPYADAFIDRLQTDLKRTDPVYVVHSDHGEAFGEHGSYGHEKELFEENLHVPLVVGNTNVTDTSSRPVSLRALPTLLESLATGNPETIRNRIDRMESQRPVFARTKEGGKVAVRFGNFKYIVNTDGTGELFDLNSDPEETADRTSEFPDVKAELHRVVDRFNSDIKERSTIQTSVESVEWKV